MSYYFSVGTSKLSNMLPFPKINYNLALEKSAFPSLFFVP